MTQQRTNSSLSKPAASPRVPGFRFIHSPGPTRVPDEVMHAMQRPMMDLADPRVARTIVACEDGMRRLLRTERSDIIMYAANGHGMWEATAVNLTAPGRTLLIAGGGHFSDQWAVQTEAIGATVQRTAHVEGYPMTLLRSSKRCAMTSGIGSARC